MKNIYSFIKKVVCGYAIEKSAQYIKEMEYINESKVLGLIPKGSFMEGMADFRYAILELKIEILMLFVPHDIEKIE